MMEIVDVLIGGVCPAKVSRSDLESLGNACVAFEVEDKNLHLLELAKERNRQGIGGGYEIVEKEGG